jgi:hypothetical protein
MLGLSAASTRLVRCKRALPPPDQIDAGSAGGVKVGQLERHLNLLQVGILDVIAVELEVLELVHVDPSLNP